VLPRDEGEHRRLELELVHLPVRLGEADTGTQSAEQLGRLVQRFDPVVEEEDLAATLLLPHDRPADEVLVVGPDVGPNGTAALRRRLDHGDVAQAGQGHLQGAGDRGGREREHVHLELELAEELLLADPETLFLVDDHQAEVLATHVAGEQPVGADQDVDPALPVAIEDVAHLGRPAQPGDHLDVERRLREALAERAEMLLGKDRGRHQHHHLLAVRRGLVGGAECDLSLAVADVAADQPVHGALRLHVGLDGVDRIHLVGGLAIGERRLEVELQLAVRGEGVTLPNLALGVEVDQVAGHRAGRPPRP
jgi:hypothetical protein